MFVKPARVCVIFDSKFFPERFKYSWITPHRRGAHKEPAPHGFKVTKGSTHMAVTRQFVQFVLTDSTAQDLLRWMSDVKIPDEYFFSTLNHNPQLNIPGSFLG